jgi:cephalosporin hydroxylase
VVTGIAERLGHLTDKFSLGYYPAYQELAREIGPAGRVLEVGVYRGGSLLMWQELFPGGLVAGADNDPGATWPPGTRRIVAHQADPGLAEAARQASPDGYDLIVDDASHIGELSAATLELLWPLVRPGGWYVLEDWTVSLAQPWAAEFGDAPLRLAESFLRRIGPGRDADRVAYRYGQAMLRKRDDAR